MSDETNRNDSSGDRYVRAITAVSLGLLFGLFSSILAFNLVPEPKENWQPLIIAVFAVVTTCMTWACVYLPGLEKKRKAEGNKSFAWIEFKAVISGMCGVLAITGFVYWYFVGSQESKDISNWATLIGALVAFNGVVLAGLLANFFNRRRDRNLHEQESAVLAMSIASEISELCTILKAFSNTLDRRLKRKGKKGLKNDAASLDQFVKIFPTEIYSSNIQKIGQLDGTLAVRIIKFYSRVAFFKHAPKEEFSDTVVSSIRKWVQTGRTLSREITDTFQK